MKYRRNVLKNVGIMVIALALLITGVAMADPGIEATTQISFPGENGAQITSTESSVGCESGPEFCNRVEAGSSFTMNVANARTGTNNRFVAGSETTPPRLNHDIRVDAPGITPSVGKVSAFAKGSTSNLCEHIEFNEKTSVDGQITLFEKEMHWESGSGRV